VLASVHPLGHRGERAELINDRQPLRERPGHAVCAPTAMLTPSMDRKNSSSAQGIDSMSVCTRMPGTLTLRSGHR
jgi:hypothetical protein